MANIASRGCLAGLLLMAGILGVRAQDRPAQNVPPVVIDYFYEAGCADCLRVRDQIMPALRERFEGFYVVNRYDLGERSNVVRLVSYQEQLGIKENRPVCMVVDYQYVLNGFDAIRAGLIDRVDECLAERQEPGWRPAVPIAAPSPGDDELVHERARRFTFWAVLTGGLIDGINPCAISTLVFFMSLLAVAKVRGPSSSGSASVPDCAAASRGYGLLVIGASYCLASFVTYTAIGFGLLRALYLFTGFPMLRFGLEVVMMGLLAVFAYLSFRDAYRYAKTGRADEVTLQLPVGLKERIHTAMKSGLEPSRALRATAKEESSAVAVDHLVRRSLGGGGRSTPAVKRAPVVPVLRLAVAGFTIGAAVTAIESVCTGQVYVPTLVLVAWEGGAASRTAWSYLLLYNSMFIVPLVAIFILSFLGLRTQMLLAWSKRNVVRSKVLMGVFFLVMAGLIAIV